MATLLELRDRARDRADMDGSTFVEDAELNNYINSSAAILYDFLVAAYEDYFTIVPAPELTVASGSNTLDLPSDFYKLKGLDFKHSAGDYSTVTPYVFRQRNAIDSAGVQALGLYTPVKYRILGKKLHFLPEDSASGTYRLWYIPKFTRLVADNDDFDGVNGWEEFIVIDAAIKMLNKEESDVSTLLLEKQELKQHIIALAADRDAGEGEVIGDVHSHDDSLGDF